MWRDPLLGAEAAEVNAPAPETPTRVDSAGEFWRAHDIRRARGVTLRVVLLAAALVSGCGDSSSPPPTVAGAWRGLLFDGDSLRLVLTQTGTSVSGTGTRSTAPHWGPVQTFDITASGTFVHPHLELTIQDGDWSPAFEGALVSRGRIEGVYGGDLFGRPLTLVK